MSGLYLAPGPFSTAILGMASGLGINSPQDAAGSTRLHLAASRQAAVELQ